MSSKFNESIVKTYCSCFFLPYFARGRRREKLLTHKSEEIRARARGGEGGEARKEANIETCRDSHSKSMGDSKLSAPSLHEWIIGYVDRSSSFTVSEKKSSEGKSDGGRKQRRVAPRNEKTAAQLGRRHGAARRTNNQQ